MYTHGENSKPGGSVNSSEERTMLQGDPKSEIRWSI